MIYLRIALIAACAQMIYSKGTKPTVECIPDLMQVTIPLDGNRKTTYLDQMKDYSPCRPSITDGVATFSLDLAEPHRCGVTRVLHKATGKRVFYHKMVIEDQDGGRETVTARCVVVPEHIHIVKRAVELPAGFQEPEYLEITKNLEEKAAPPQLSVEVKQNGKKISGEVSVKPGAPLSMEIYLDDKSAPVYGLMLGYMQVTDTKNQHETIIVNGCSLDPHLFDNFVTTNGDRLTAKFRAFKFPDTNYVQFRGTVTVCLDMCQGVQCSNGATGFGRRKREVDSSGDPNKVYEVSLTTFIKMENNGDKEAEDILALLENLKNTNQMLYEKDASMAVVHERKRHDIALSQTANETANSSTNVRNSFLLACAFFFALRW